MEVCRRTKLLSLNPGDTAGQLGDAAGSAERCRRGWASRVEAWPALSLRGYRESLQARGGESGGARTAAALKKVGADALLLFPAAYLLPLLVTAPSFSRGPLLPRIQSLRLGGGDFSFGSVGEHVALSWPVRALLLSLTSGTSSGMRM